MSEDKWATVDYSTTAHWWLGSAGTACGLDFKRDLRRAAVEDPHCHKCEQHQTAAV